MAHIELNNVNVSFQIYGHSSRSLKRQVLGSVLGGRLKSESDESVVIQALNGISLKLEHGDRLGLMGHNGAGKSTLLRVIAGIYPVLDGSIKVEGRVTPLISIGHGLEFDATGYENILLRGFYLGYNRKEVEEKISAVAEFSDLGQYLDLPVRTYSAGMVSRLLYATSTAFDPEILVLDEGIGTGDAAFMKKIKTRTAGFVQKASIVVLASHSNHFIREHCNIGAILESGRMKSFGPIDEQIRLYESSVG